MIAETFNAVQQIISVQCSAKIEPKLLAWKSVTSKINKTMQRDNVSVGFYILKWGYLHSDFVCASRTSHFKLKKLIESRQSLGLVIG